MKSRIVLTANESKELSSVNDIIHDCPFEKNEIRHDPESLVLEIAFAYEARKEKRVLSRVLFIKKICVPIYRYVLRVENAQSYLVCEGKQEGPGDDDYFNKIVYDPREKLLTIKTIIAEEIKIGISQLRLSIDTSFEIIKEKIYWGI